MQGMLDNLSQPVAFATVPLGHPEIPISPSSPDKTDDIRRDGSLSSDTDLDEPIFSKFTRRIGISRKGSKNDHSGLSSRKFPSNGKQPEHEIEGSFEDNEEFFDEGYSSALHWKAARLTLSLSFKVTIYQDHSAWFHLDLNHPLQHLRKKIYP